VHHKLDIVSLRALGDGLDGADGDLSLNLILFNVVKAHVCQQEGPILLHHPSVDLYHDAGENHLFTTLCVHLRHNI